MLLVLVPEIAAGQMVSLGGYPSDWLLIDRVQGSRLCLRRLYGEPARFLAEFWIDAKLVHEVRWPNLPPPGERRRSVDPPPAKNGAEGQS